jgi:hypothetical protein
MPKPNFRELLDQTETESKLEMRTRNAAFLRKAFGVSLSVSLGAYALQGFQFTGFHLSETSLNWLGVATIGQIAALFAMVIRQK